MSFKCERNCTKVRTRINSHGYKEIVWIHKPPKANRQNGAQPVYTFTRRTGEGDLRRAVPSPSFPNPPPWSHSRERAGDLPGKQQSWGAPFPALRDDPASYVSCSSEEKRWQLRDQTLVSPCPFPWLFQHSGTCSLACCGTLLGWSFSFPTQKTSLDLVFPLSRGSSAS